MAKKSLKDMNEKELRDILSKLLDDYENLYETAEFLKKENEELLKRQNQFKFKAWDDIFTILDNENDLVERNKILIKTLSEKAICKNQQCPAYLDIGKLTQSVYQFKKSKDFEEYGEDITNPIQAKEQIWNKIKLNRWLERYKEICYKQIQALNEMYKIGSSNETVKREEVEKKEEAHRRSKEKLQIIGELQIPYHSRVGEDIDRDIQTDEKILYPDDPDLHRKGVNLFDDKKEKKKKDKKEDMK